MSLIPITSDEHWRELRKQYVGGSEVAALFNACSYLTHLELWLTKRGEISGDIAESERMFWGKLIEEPVAQAAAIRWGLQVENRQCYAICDDTPGMGCTPDRFIEDADGRKGLMQIKTVDRLEYLKWEDGQPPLSYQLQLQHEMACVGLSWGVLAPLVGGNELKRFDYDAHPEAIGKIKHAITSFWESVRTGKQPPAVSDDYQTLMDIAGRVVDAIDLTQDNELPVLCATATAAAARRLASEKEEKAAKAAILERINGYTRALCQGFTIDITTVNRKAYSVAASSYQQMRIKENLANV